MEIKRELNTKFAEIFGPKETTQYFSPGRINLIGEHTDYNGGHVFPASITYGTYGIAAPREDKKVLVYSTNFEDIGVITFDVDQLDYDKKDNWANYAKGMVLKLKDAGHKIDHGFELLVEGTIPLDTNTLKYEMVPVKLDGYAVVIMNTNKRRELADSKYNERRSECEEALARLQKKLDIQALGDLDEATFEANIDLIGDDTLIRRARHAVTENQRTLEAKAELEKGNLEAFGKLLNASHYSLRHDYEVTGIELDTLVDAAQAQSGVLGARMTGAGFGGCAIAVVKEENIPTFKNKVYDKYMEIVGYAPDFYVAHIGRGTTKIG